MAPAPVAPTPPAPLPTGERVISIDVVRGLAVLGILVMNIVEFGLPLLSYGNPSVAGGTEGADLVTWLVQAALFDGRMRALFSMLFGAGLVLIGTRLERSGRADTAADVLLRRCLWLIPFGIAHRFLLQWTGDILYIYGLLGALAIAFRKLRAGTLLALGLLTLLAFVPMELRKYGKACEQRTAAAEAVALEAAGAEVPAEMQRLRTRWERRSKPRKDNANDAELAAMHGSWLDIARHRWDHNHAFQHAFLYYYFFFDVFGMFLIGLGLGRLGFFAGRLRTFVYVATVGLGLSAAATSLWFAQRWAAADWSRTAIDLLVWRDSSYALLRGLTGLGWASAVILLLRLRLATRLLQPLAAVGRMAFTNYILQTVCCTTLFFGWGLDHYGAFSRAELMLVVLAVSLLQVVFSVAWLRFFRFGPLEYAWRALTYGQWPPLRRAAD